MEGLSKKGKALMDMDNSLVIAVWEGVSVINGNGRNITFKKEENKIIQHDQEGFT